MSYEGGRENRLKQNSNFWFLWNLNENKKDVHEYETKMNGIKNVIKKCNTEDEESKRKVLKPFY